MTIKRNEEIGLKLILGQAISKEDIIYIQKYCVGSDSKVTEDEVLATDYLKLPRGYRALQTSLLRRGYTVTGKRPEWLKDDEVLQMMKDMVSSSYER